ncbi:MAG: OmpA family protein [Dysgonamonadaceae bacterium]|jgi:outer membrane protein OmpA-like peptidoglycan-associated protein|nr:OmpA family protein [Dysgonamonadaceae bacterium]
MKSSFKLFLAAGLLLSSAAVVNAQDLPATADPGKCYVKCIVPDEYKDVTETIVVEPEYKVLKVIPATYKVIEERVVVKEASKKYVYHPAVYGYEDVAYEKKAPETNLTVIPAKFGSSNKVIETQPKSGRWEYTQLADCPSANKDDCVVACYVEHPAVTENVPITTLLSAASTSQSVKAGTNDTYRKQVVKTPARVEEIDIPAEYATIKRTVVDRAAGVEETVVPAVSKTVTRRELVKKGGMTVWEAVDCNLVGTNNILPIFYEYNSAKLTAESEKIIDEHLLKLMREKPNLRIEIMSHTDSRGDDAYNMSLSQQRAQSVVNYLVSKGISRSRLEAKGYGETRLVNRCENGVQCSEAEHQQNRRTEFRIIQ